MSISDLLSLLNQGFTIFPMFNIEFPFHIAYDIIIRLASSWILEDSAEEIATFFNSAFGSTIRYMYDPDQTFLKMCFDMWNSTTKFALALLPLMLILSIFSTVKLAGERSSLTLVRTQMNKNFFCVLFFLLTMFLMIFCGSVAEIYEDPDMCFSLTQDGWIKDLINAYEIKASDSNLYGYDAFSTLTFAAELGKVDFEINRDPAKPYDRALIIFDGESFNPASSDTTKPVTVIMNAIMDPTKLDEDLYQQYASLKYSVIDDKQKMRQDILIWANEQGKQVPIDGIFWFIDLPEEYDQKDIARYGSVLNYLTRFVYEAKQSSLDFSKLLSSIETDENGIFKTRTTRQLTGRGYSIGLIADPSFVFLTIADTDAVLFSNNDSVIEYYAKVISVF